MQSQPTWWMSIMKSWAQEEQEIVERKKLHKQSFDERAKSGFWLVFIAIRHCVLLHSSLLLSKLTKKHLEALSLVTQRRNKEKKSSADYYNAAMYAENNLWNKWGSLPYSSINSRVSSFFMWSFLAFFLTCCPIISPHRLRTAPNFLI